MVVPMYHISAPWLVKINYLLYDPQHVPLEIHINVQTLAFYDLDQRSQLVNLQCIHNPDPSSTPPHPQERSDLKSSDIIK